jgi:RNA polymerase sigma factor (sigma-70 family)
VDAARSRDDATVERIGALYERGYHTYLRVAEAIVGDPDRAHDAVQDAFARAIRSSGSYRATGSLEGWIWRTVVNTARNTRRDAPPEHLPLHDLGEDALSGNGRSVEGGLRAVIAALPERQRLVLFLRYYADLDYEGIGDALEIKPGTVGATLNQAHSALRCVLEGVPR